MDYEQKRAANFENELKETKVQINELQIARDQWKQTFLDEHKASEKLLVSLTEARIESASLRNGLSIAQTQRELDKERIATLETENKSLRRSRWKFAAAGFALGFATGVPTGLAVSYRFQF